MYKNSHPDCAAFNKSGDSKLLAKKKHDTVKGYLMGGGVDPNRPDLGTQGASTWYEPARGASEFYIPAGSKPNPHTLARIRRSRGE